MTQKLIPGTLPGDCTNDFRGVWSNVAKPSTMGLLIEVKVLGSWEGPANQKNTFHIFSSVLAQPSLQGAFPTRRSLFF